MIISAVNAFTTTFESLIRKKLFRELSEWLYVSCLQIAHNVFEAGLKRFMHEPGYILE